MSHGIDKKVTQRIDALMIRCDLTPAVIVSVKYRSSPAIGPDLENSLGLQEIIRVKMVRRFCGKSIYLIC